MSIEKPLLDLIGKSLDLRLKNQGVIASNVANADTPNYKALKMDFESKLQEIVDLEGGLDTTDPLHLPNISQALSDAEEVTEDPDATVQNNGNSVNRDRELSKLAQEQQMYSANITTLNKKLAMLKYAINEGGNR